MFTRVVIKTTIFTGFILHLYIAILLEMKFDIYLFIKLAFGLLVFIITNNIIMIINFNRKNFISINFQFLVYRHQLNVALMD